MPLLGCEGGLLGCEAGLSLECCSYGDKCNPDPNCPRCCTKITGGELVGGNLEFTTSNEYGTLVVKVSGVGEDRLVCKGEGITVETVFTPSDLPDPGLPFPVAGWDRLWSYQGHSPEIDNATGYLSEYGVIQWGEITETDVSVTLNYNACFEDILQQYGDILIGLQNYGLYISIAFETCPLSENCCDDSVDCKPCCWVVPLDQGISNESTGDIVFIYSEGGYTLRVAIPERELYCEHEGGGVNLEIELIPPPDVYIRPGSILVSHEGWYGEIIPTDPSNCGDPENFITDFDPGQYKVDLELLAFDCEGMCPGVPGQITVTASGPGIPTLSIDISLESCDEALGVTPEERANCPCCKSLVCCDDCYFPPHPDACKGTNTGGPFEDAPVQVTNMVIETTASQPVYCNGTSSISRAEQVGPSIQEVICYRACLVDQPNILVSFPACSYQIPMQTIACPGDEENAIVFVKVTYVNNRWEVSAGAGNENSSSCSGASITSTGVINGITYTVDTSFTVTGGRSCNDGTGGDDDTIPGGGGDDSISGGSF